MGMMVCERHGQQLLAFTAPRIAAALEDSARISALGPIRKISLSYMDIPGRYLVDDEFVADNNLHGTGEGLSAEQSEAVFERLIPVCSECLAKLIEARADKP